LNHIHGNLISYVDQRFGTEDVFVSTWRIIPTPHAPIYINDNTDFTTQGFPGLGTVDQPYVIAHLYIESNDNTLIEIENTDAFFIIRDCILDGVDCLFSGLILTSVTNGWIVGNEVRNCRNGIGLQYSSSNVIEYNHVENNHNIGIFVWNSDGNHLYRNTAFDSGYCGFTCTYGSGNTLVENSASRSTQLSWTLTRGFMLSESSDNDLIQNTAHNCERGIFLAYDSTSNTLSGNTVTLCKYGFYLQDSPSNIIDGLEGAGKIEGYNVELKGIFIHNSDGVTVRDYWIEGFAIGIHILECTEGTITVNHIRDNGVAAVALTDTSKITIERNIFSENMLGISLTESSSSNSIYLNLFMDNKQQVLDNGLNVWSFRESLGNFWSNYFGRDGNTDGIGDTDLPHEGVDWYPLMNPSIPMRYGQLPVGDDWWLYASYLIWRGGWSPVDIRVTDEQGRILSEDLNEIGLNAWFIEDDQWEPGTTMVMAIIAVGPMSPYETQQYTFEMTALENLDYSMEWFVSYGDVANELGGEVLFRESVENVALAVGETRLVELKIAQNPDGSVVVPEYTFSGVLEPINADGTSVFKRGRTIPVKFQLFDDAGLPVSTAQATIEVAKVSDDVVGTFEEGSSTSAADTGNVFRFDPEAQQYIFNLGTKTLETGTYVLRITLDDGQIFEVRFALR
jgi:parallel beta-helix repeat protein